MGKLRVALIGCGQIADAHLAEVQKISTAKLVAVCDTYRDLAEQAAARFNVTQVFDNVDDLLKSRIADVVHITTPVHTHCSLAVKALEAGLHVYLEKPFTVDVPEADTVLEAARRTRQLVCIGHNQLYDPIWLECRRLVASGALGDVVHVESVLGYDLQGPFGRLAANPTHWVNRLPGGLIQNVISHPLYRVTDFLTDSCPEIVGLLKESNTSNPMCELRATLLGERVTGSLLISSSIRPHQKVTRVYGTRQYVEVDMDAGVIRTYRPSSTRGPFVRLETPYRHFCEAARNLTGNLWKLMRSDLHFFAGMRTLFEEFYKAIAEGGPPPIPYAEILRFTSIMDALFQTWKRVPAGGNNGYDVALAESARS